MATLDLPPPVNQIPIKPTGFFEQTWADWFQQIAAAVAFKSIANGPSHANDAAAAAAGVAKGSLYRNGSVLMIRVV